MRSRAGLGWLIGFLSAAIAIGVGETVAAFVRPAASPLIAVGNRVITLTPESLKRDGIRKAGTNDKTLLILGICLLLALIGAFVGELALRKLWWGLAGIGLIGGFGVYCALTANASHVSDIVPTLIGTLVAAGVLAALVRLARPAPQPTAATTTTSTTSSTKTSRTTPGKPATTSGGAFAGLADRRGFLQGTVATAGIAAIAGFGGRAAQSARFSVASDRAKVKLPAAAAGDTAAHAAGVPTGTDLGKSGVAWRTPNADFYRIDTALSIPQISSHSWKLRIHGMVDKPITITYAQLLARPQVQRWITLNCVSNEVGGELVSNALFEGARLADLLREAGLHPGADQLLMTSVDGMTIGAPARVVMDGREALLAVGMNGQPLPLEHGYPVRVVVPGLYGYVSACKWVVDIEATTFAAQQAYWVQGGWATAPPIRLASRIDRPSSSETVNVGETVAIAGVAWDQHVGVSKVEVQVDNGPWQAARLAAVPSTDTWRQWVLPWTPEKSGSHTLRVRATDARGRVQDTKHRDVFPSGATGLHTVSVHAVV